MTSPDWPRLYEIASSQAGLFTTKQAADAGYSRPLLAHHIQAGTFQRVQRGIYRLTYFPAGENEDLVAAWLWTEGAGVLSHESALALHRLSDALPAHIDLTLPASWRRRRLVIPPLLRLHFADIPPEERTWVGAVPVTAPLRTLRDCAADHVPPGLIAQAIRDGRMRGLFSQEDAAELERV